MKIGQMMFAAVVAIMCMSVMPITEASTADDMLKEQAVKQIAMSAEDESGEEYDDTESSESVGDVVGDVVGEKVSEEVDRGIKKIGKKIFGGLF